jgi:hypothetical protein
VTADISFAIQVKIGGGANYSLGSGCVQTTTASAIYCAVPDNLASAPSIQYAINLLQTAFIIDQIYSTVASTGVDQTIAFDFY